MDTLRAILFDLDGVLVRSEETWMLTLEEAGRVFRGRPISREEYLPSFGQGTAADIEKFGLACTVDELNRFYTATFPQKLSSTWVNPEAAALLECLKGWNLRLALVTNTVSSLAAIILRHAGLTHFFDVVACADQVAMPKPYPDLVHHALQALQMDASASWLIGDSRYDRQAAQAANVHFVGLSIDGDHRVDCLADLKPLVQAERDRVNEPDRV